MATLSGDPAVTAAQRGSAALLPALLADVLRDAHRYAPGLEPLQPALRPRGGPAWRRALAAGRERSRDALERAAGRAGFSHRHFSPERGASALERIIELAPELERTYARLGDARSRQAMLDVLKLRVLGPYHAPLRVTPEDYRERQRHADRELRVTAGTYEVSDPYFSPLSQYRVPVAGGPVVTLHSHSVDVVSVFGLGQYAYGSAVRAREGDIVLDIGGCWGDTALYFAALVGSGGKVFTFEFDPESLEIMKANLALNPELAKRIEIVPRALWDSSGEELEVAQAGRMTSVGGGDGGPGTVRVPTITVDDFIEEAGLERVDFVKMDVEGAEPRVLRGAAQTLAQRRPRMAIAAYHRDDDLARLPEALGDHYRLYLESYSSVEDETVLFASAEKNST